MTFHPSNANGRIVAARSRPSVRGRLVARCVLPLLFRKQTGVGALRRRIAEDRAKGPAIPSARLRERHRFADTRLGGERVLRLAPRDGGDTLRILYIHGGAYVFDLMPLQWTMAAGIIAATGAEMVLPLYPLAPEGDVDDGLVCVERVYRALLAEAGAGNVVVMGDSAGGGLALALAHRLRDEGQPLPLALLLLFPWLDATLCDPGQPALEHRDPMLAIDQLREAGSMWAAGADPAAPSVSPLFGRQSSLPPMLALVGTHDLLLPDSLRLAQSEADVEVVTYPGMFHGFVAAPIPEARDAIKRIAAFVRRHAGGGS